MPSKFDEIRPYNDSDLPNVLKELVDNEAFIRTLVGFRFAKWPTFTKPLLGAGIKYLVAKKFQKTNTLRDFQLMVEPYMERMIKTTTSALTVTGLETLDLSKPCLFVSNHRDIALDPAFVNWVLHINGQDTVRIAVGDNLLKNNWVAHLLRLNKCFIVQRSVAGRREKLAAAKLLSEYIHYSLKNSNKHIWIAQREGRAKDGIDVTNPAIVSMLLLNKPKEMSFGDYVADLRIIPVSISYEFDPCDISKAKELDKQAQNGSYDKPDNEDMQSIVSGITGEKGRVNVHFGKLVGAQCTDAKAVSTYLDAEILAGYQTFSTSAAALNLLKKEVQDPSLDFSPQDADEQSHSSSMRKAETYLSKRLESLKGSQRIRLLQMYANPLIRKHHKSR